MNATPPPGPPAPAPDARDQPAAEKPEPAAPEPAARFWAVRRAPAGLTALAVLTAVGLLLYDVAAVRADQPATAWRTALARELATRRMDDPWVIAAACAAVLLGAWLLLLAATPGLRGVLPMRRDLPELRAGLDRRAAAQMLRERALEVTGVRSVHVVAGRQRLRVRAEAHFRELPDVRRDLDTALGRAVDELGLARRPELSLRVHRPAKG